MSGSIFRILARPNETKLSSNQAWRQYINTGRAGFLHAYDRAAEREQIYAALDKRFGQ